MNFMVPTENSSSIELQTNEAQAKVPAQHQHGVGLTDRPGCIGQVEIVCESHSEETTA